MSKHHLNRYYHFQAEAVLQTEQANDCDYSANLSQLILKGN